MGYDLYSRKKIFRSHIEDFPKLLDLAYLFGWKPRGTEAPSIEGYSEWKSEEWKGGYFSNDFQVVTSEDAIDIAESLKKAIQIIPNFIDGPYPKNKDFFQITGDEKKDRLLSYFIGDKNELKEFIAFCEDGEFCIS